MLNINENKEGFVNKRLPRLKATELFGSAVCNLNCSYCYIPKNERMKQKHKEIVEALESDEFIESLKLIYGKELTHLSLWGTEPTLVIDKLQKNFKKYLDEFPNLTTFGFSTNFVSHVDKLTDFMTFLSKQDRKIVMDMQISIDGPEWVTDSGRGIGVTKSILKNLDKLREFLDGRDLKNVTVDLKYKATVAIEDMEKMNKDNKILEEWYFFSYKLAKMFLDVKSKNLNKPSFSLASLVVPGTYTSKDGKIFAEFVRKTREFQDKVRKENLMPEYDNMPSFNSYTYRFGRMMNSLDDYLYKNPYNATCSGFDTQGLLDKNGDLMACHRLVLFNDDEFTKNIEADAKYSEDWDVSKIHKGIIDNMKKHFIPNVHLSPQKDFDKYTYISRATHEFMKFRISNTTTMIRELAFAGQINSAFEEINLAQLLSVYINTVNSCPVENYLNTGSWQLNLVSMARIYGNGAFKEFMDEYMEKAKFLGGKDYGLQERK